MPEKARKGAGFERRRKHEKANITKVDISYRATLAHLESMFGHDRFPARIVQLLAGLCLYGVSMAMMVHADLGLDPWNVLHQGLSPRIGLSFGQTVNLVGLAVLVLWWPLRQKPGLGTVLNIVVIGTVTDIALVLLPTPEAYVAQIALLGRSEEHTSELQSLMRISYAVLCLKKKNNKQNIHELT